MVNFDCVSSLVLYNVGKRGTIMKIMEVVCGVMEQDHRVFIAKRGKGVHENMWEFPGGKIEPNETAQQAIIRELKEELDIEVDVEKFLVDVMDQRVDICIHVSAYLCNIRKGTPVLHVHHEMAWVSADELASYTFEAADEAILQCVKRELT